MRIPFMSNPSVCLQKLDRLPWQEGLSFLTYGVRMGVRVTDSAVLPLVRTVLPPGLELIDSSEVDHLISFPVGGPGPQPRQRLYHLVYAEVSQMARTHDLDVALHAVERSAQLLVSCFAPRHVFLHAGAVAWNGRIILIPGRSFVGKSRLVAALLKAGAEYYSDEFAVLDEQGLVHPYPRKLSLRDAEGTLRTRITAEELGSRTGRQPLPIGTVALTEFRAGADWNPRSVSRSKAALALLNNTVAIRRVPKKCLAVIERVVAHAECVMGSRGEAAETAERLLAACA